MGPESLEQVQEKLAGRQGERKLAELKQLWEDFGLRWAFLEANTGQHLNAIVVSETGAGPLKETGGMLSLQLTPFRSLTGFGVRERADNSQLYLATGEKELHLCWPSPLSSMLGDEVFRWIVRQVAVQTNHLSG